LAATPPCGGAVACLAACKVHCVSLAKRLRKTRAKMSFLRTKSDRLPELTVIAARHTDDGTLRELLTFSVKCFLMDVMAKVFAVSSFGTHVRKRRPFRIIAAVLVVAALAVGITMFFNDHRKHVRNERQEVRAMWEAADYKKVYDICGEKLEDFPLDTYYLVLSGFSAYQIAMSQINAADTGIYLDNAIWSLRKALLTPQGRDDQAVFYVLGKAYFHKGEFWADMAVRYLEAASPINSPDIPEYLGLSYASLKEYRKSVIAFSSLLADNNSSEGHSVRKNGESAISDTLLNAIAKSYVELGEYETANSYLLRTLEISKDSNTVVSARLLLGDILIKQGKNSDAEKQYLAIIDECGENAHARFRLGELYALRGDQTGVAMARAEWRKALRIDPTFVPARERLNL
jgi:tetratricopeptide (TPR) repeat protein